MKRATIGHDARKKILVGATTVSQLVGLTMGLNGKNVLMRGYFPDPGTGKPYPKWKYTKDGVSVSRDFYSDDQEIDTGASAVRSACESTVNSEGDGTSLTAVICGALMTAGDEKLTAGANPAKLKKGMEDAADLIISEIKKCAYQIKDADGAIDHKLAREVAMIASNSDESVGGIVADAIKKVSSEGMITIEPSHDYKTSVDTLNGVLLAGSTCSQYFITNIAKQTVELENPYILLFDRELNLFKPLQPLIEKILKVQGSLLIICQDCKNEALSTIVSNKMRGGLKVAVIKMSDFGIQKRKVLEDIAIATNGEFWSEEKGKKLEKVTLNDLGRAERVIIDKNDTIIITKKFDLKDEEGNDKDVLKYTPEERVFVAHQEKLKEYTSTLKQHIDNEENPEDKKLAQTRYAHLTGGVAVIHVGGKTQEEVSEKIDRVDDALCASRSAIKNGIIAGGGSAFLKLALKIMDMPFDNDDVRKGQLILKSALEAPFKQLLDNGGIKYELSITGSLVGKTSIIETVQDSEMNIGYNLATEKIENLRDAGIIDSAGVLIAALENAVSASGMFFLLGATIMPDR